MKRLIPFIILAVVGLFYTRPFFRPGFFATHDGEWAIIRMAEMQRELRDRQFPPRWADNLNHGYGYPLFSFTYPGPFYAGGILTVFNIGLVDSVKIIFVGSVLLSALFMFLLGRELAGDYGGFLASLFYTVAPFRLVDLYVRGSIGESVSLALFPMLFYLSLKYILKPTSFRMVLCSLTMAFLILSHNIMALLFIPLWIIFLYVAVISYYEDVRRYTWRFFLPMVVLGLGLSSYFFIPAIAEKEYIMLSGIKLSDISQHFIRLPDYLISPWGYGLKPSFQLGWAHILGAIIGMVSVVFSGEIYRKKHLPTVIFILGGIVSLVLLAHPISADFWNSPPLSWLDFPWRLMTPLAFFLALSAVFLSIHRTARIIGTILVIITVIFSLRFAQPKEYINKPDAYYATNDATTTSMDELMPIWVIEKPVSRYASKVVLEKANSTINGLEYNSRNIKFRTVTSQPNVLKINTVYFPGWKFYVKGEEVPLNFRSPDGVIRIDLKPGNYYVEGHFTETPVRFWSDIVSLISSFVVVIIFGYTLISILKTRFTKAT